MTTSEVTMPGPTTAESIKTQNTMPVPVPVTAASETMQLEVTDKPKPAITDAEARSMAVAELLATAYANASTLQLTKDEGEKLRAPFRDDMVNSGARGDPNLIYISHIHLSDRLNDVLGVGQWAIVKRTHRTEETQTREGNPLTRIYFEGVLLIRGSFVAEAIGVGNYHPNNPKEDYGSALESAMSDCLTRCCKRLGIGSQVWDKSYCDKWLQENRGRPEPRPAQSTTPQANSRLSSATIEGGDDNVIYGMVEKVLVKSGKKKDGTPWTRYGIIVNGRSYGTFDTKIGADAEALLQLDAKLTVEQSGEYWNLLAIVPRDETSGGDLPALEDDSPPF